MFLMEDRQVRRLARNLEREAPKALAYAARDVLNRQAFDGRKAWQSEMASTFTLRNRWTVGSVRVQKASGLNVSSMQSVLGSALDYLETQEEGGTKSGMAVPTSVSSGEGAGAKPRKRQVRKRHWLSRIQLEDRPGGSRKQRNAAAIAIARRKGVKVAYLEANKRGIFQIPKGKRGKIKMLWSFSEASAAIPPHPTLGPAEAKVRRKMPRYAKAALLRQLKRRGLA